jgi:hypothetical protein
LSIALATAFVFTSETFPARRIWFSPHALKSSSFTVVFGTGIPVGAAHACRKPTPITGDRKLPGTSSETSGIDGGCDNSVGACSCYGNVSFVIGNN